MLSLVGFFALLIIPAIMVSAGLDQWIAAIIVSAGLDQWIAPTLLALGMWLAACGWMAIRQARARRRERLRRSPLSCDELRVARSKLMKDRNAKRI